MHTFIYEYMMDLVAPLVAPALSQKPAFVTYFVARGAPRPCYIPEGFDSLPYIYIYTCVYRVCTSFATSLSLPVVSRHARAQILLSGLHQREPSSLTPPLQDSPENCCPNQLTFSWDIPHIKIISPKDA